MTAETTANKSRAGWARSLALSAVLLIALLGLAEAALRTSYVFEAPPIPMPYYTYDVTHRLHHFDMLTRERGPVDVLFVGSSVVRAGFRPQVFDKAVHKAGGGQVLSFNGGFSKMYGDGVRMYFEHVWLAHDKPRFALHGIRPNELMSELERAPSFLRHSLVESLWFEDNPLSMLEAELIGRSKLLQYRGTLNAFLQRWSKGQPIHSSPAHDKLLSDSTGYRQEPGKLSTLLRHKRGRLWTYSVKVKRSDFERGLRVLDAMRRLCAKAGVQYVLMHLPEHANRYGHERGPATWQLYQEMVKTWAKVHDVPFIDVTRGDYKRFADVEHYSDYHHLSASGAKVLSELVAQDFAALLKARGEIRIKRD
jgi:hypothetical protein